VAVFYRETASKGPRAVAATVIACLGSMSVVWFSASSAEHFNEGTYASEPTHTDSMTELLVPDI